MKFGMNLYVWTTNLTQDFLRVLKDVKGYGYDGVEVPVAPENANNYLDIKKCLADLGLACTTITNVGADADPISPDLGVRLKGLDRICRALEISALLGSGTLAGPFYAAYGVFSGLGPTLDPSLHGHRRTSSATRRSTPRVPMCEPQHRVPQPLRGPTSLNTTGQGYKRFVEMVGQPNFGILYDTHHAHHEEDDVGAAIRDAGPAINHVHFSENQRGTLGSGLVNWAATVEAPARRQLRRLGDRRGVQQGRPRPRRAGARLAQHLQDPRTVLPRRPGIHAQSLGRAATCPALRDCLNEVRGMLTADSDPGWPAQRNPAIHKRRTPLRANPAYDPAA